MYKTIEANVGHQEKKGLELYGKGCYVNVGKNFLIIIRSYTVPCMSGRKEYVYGNQ